MFIIKRYLLIVFTFLLFSCIRQEEDSLKESPNIILIMSDDQGWGDVGYQGHPELKTPNLDQMAANGLQFNRFYAAAPVCSPTRASVLTGRHPYRFGIKYANVGHIPKETLLLPEILKNHGYVTGHFGKWHLGTMSKYVIESNRGGYSWSAKHYSPPWENGFDEVFSTESKSPTWDPMINPPLNVNGANNAQKPGDSYGTYYWTGKGCIATENLNGVNSRVIMDRVIPFIDESAEQDLSFFCVIWFHTPHSPVIAGDQYKKRYAHLSENKQHYYGSITAMDEQIGRLREKLRSLGIAQKTMVWFCSDNGPAAEGGGPGLKAGARQQGSTGELRGRKGTLFEGGLRVPGILEWPAVIEKHRETNFPAVTSDYYLTILDILGIEIERNPSFDGMSLKPLVEGQNIEKRSKPIGFRSRFQGQDWQVWNDNRYKLIYKVKDNEYLLFDLYNDRNETTNIANEKPEKVKKMKSELQKWLDSFN
jgi:arylsulfatase A-like enzyme